MNTELQNKVDLMNRLSRQAARLGWIGFLFWFFMLTIVTALLIVVSLMDISMSVKIGIGCAGMVSLIPVSIIFKHFFHQENIIREFRRIYREVFLDDALKEFYEDADYRWNGGISREEFLEMGIFKDEKNASYCSEDYIEGSYQGFWFRQSDARWLVTRSVGNKIKKVTLFWGRLFVFDDLFGHTYGVSDVSGEKTLLLDGVSKPVMFCIKNGKSYVAVREVDFFDPMLGEQIDYEKEYMKIRSQMHMVIDLIEMMQSVVKEDEV